MKKEIFLAIVSGVIAGIFLAFGVWKISSKLKNGTNPVSTTNPSPTAIPKDFTITLSKPNNNSIATDKTIRFEGITKPEAIIIVIAEEKDYLSKTDKDGAFFTDIDLISGLNEIKIYAFQENGKSSETSTFLVYSPEFEKYLTEIKPDEKDSTSSAENIREKVQQKIQEASLKPTFIQGSVTDISDNSIQLKTEDGSIKQLSKDESVTYAKDEDLAIGDFIIAMGFNSKQVFETKRILIAKPKETNNIIATSADITKISGKKVYYTNTSKGEFLIKFPKIWQGPDIDELEIGQNLILTGKTEEESLSLRSIFEIK